MVTAWFELIQRPFKSRDDHFVSVDARRISDPRNYEMLSSKQVANYKISSPTTEIESPKSFSHTKPMETAYFGQEASYRSPTLSFSSPRVPTRSISEASRTFTQVSRDQVYSGSIYSQAPMQSIVPPPIESRGTDSPQAHERSISAQARDQASSALGGSWDSRAPHARTTVSPGPILHRANSNLHPPGDWDPRSTYARGGTHSPDRGDSALGYTWNSEPAHLRGGV